ncbi:MAG: hypothetical protein KR126chlam2_00820, partial [Chlamydiae bacterium]|nr:hypothetical protein [Chlamydiota bacterium]
AEFNKSGLSSALRTQLLFVWSAFTNALFIVLENAVKILGVSDMINPVQGVANETARGQKLLIAITLYGALYSALAAGLGAQYGAVVFGGLFVTMVVLSVVYNKIKPPPNSLQPGTRNLTAQESGTPERDADERAMATIVKTLQSDPQALKHPLLIGKSGQGKTVTAEVLGAKIRKGEYPALKGKQVHIINAAVLANPKADLFGGSSSPLDAIMGSIGTSQRQINNIILVIDEIHELFKSAKSGNCVGSELKTRLDAGGNFPRVIGLTTWKDYATYIHPVDKAIARRFNFIPLDNFDEKKTVALMQKTLSRLSPGAIQERGVLEYIFEKTKSAPQPAAALRILLDCIERISESQKSENRKKLEETSEALRTDFCQGRSEQAEEYFPPEILEQMEGNTAEQKRLGASVDKEEKKRESFARTRQIWNSIKATLDRRAQCLRKLKQKRLTVQQLTAKEKKQVVALMLIDKIFWSQMQALLLRKQEKLGIRVRITKGMIDELLEAEVARDRKMEEEFAAGQAEYKPGDQPSDTISLSDIIAKVATALGRSDLTPQERQDFTELLSTCTALLSGSGKDAEKAKKGSSEKEEEE